MEYEDLAVQLKYKIQKLEEKNKYFQNQLAVYINENYFLKNKYEMLQNDIEELHKIKEGNGPVGTEINLTADSFSESLKTEEELNFYKNSNTYKIWIKYRKLPEPIRKIMRSMFTPLKYILKNRGK